MKQRKLLRAGAVLTALTGFGYLAAAVFVMFTNLVRWTTLGIRIELQKWDVGWWYGTALVIAAFSLQALTVPSKTVDPSAENAGRRWTFFGSALGAAAGLLFSIHYYYLMPNPVFHLTAVITGGLAGAAIHLGFFALTGLIYRSRPGWAPYGRLSFYLAVWSVLITGPLRFWEARGTEPIWSQSALAAAVGALFAFALFLTSRRRHRAAPTLAAVAVIGLSFYLIGAGRETDTEGGKDRPRRVILFTLDTTRADYLSCYGYPRPTSPNLDRLAASGVRFSRAYCNIGITDPSHASILTGVYPRTHGLIGNFRSITGPVNSLAVEFFERGYTTAAIISREHVQPHVLGVPGFVFDSGPASWIGSTSAREAYRRAANFFARHPEEDVFLWVHLFDPHQPYLIHPEVWPVEPKFPEIHGGPDYPDLDEFFTPEQIEYVRELYVGEIAYTDAWLGRFFSLFDSLPGGPEENLIIITADHGEILGEYLDRPNGFGFGHGPVYGPGMHVPLIFSRPGTLPAGLVVDDLAESVDLAPTIVELALGKPFPAQGRSLAPAIAGRGTDNRVVMEGIVDALHPDPVSAVIDDGWKLLTNVRGPQELYHFDQDPGDERDLLVDQPAEAVRLFGLWEQWKSETPHTQPEVKNYTDKEKRNLRALGYVVK